MSTLTRRRFLRAALQAACAAPLACPFLAPARRLLADEAQADDRRFVKEAMYYDKLDLLRVKCKLCPRECQVADLERGYCGVRENRGGVYYTLVHSRACSVNVDPIEKKPFFHYLPGTQAFSLATAGCNIECRFCQNWQISQFRPEQVKSIYLPPEQITEVCKRENCPTISYTYTEPVVFYEYTYDAAKYARERGVGSVIVSNGYIHLKPLEEWCKVLTGIKVDLKAFTEKFYKETCSGQLKPVLDALVKMKQLGMWLELVVLVIPTLNDTEDEFRRMTRWVVNNLGPNVPIHFTRFHPMYKIKNLPQTPIKSLEAARRIALESGVHFPYVGNVPGHAGEHTYCFKCKDLLIRRMGFYILENRLQNGKCPQCGTLIPGVWKNPLA
jgi:pyruvate formate lyase activating enzyme